jgi:CheY-like chemotaxis protein
MEPSSVGDAIQWAVTCMKSTELNDISIEVEPLPAGVCDFVVTDKHWLMENVLCYLSNSVKYSARGKITVSVSLLTEGSDRDLNESDPPLTSTRRYFENAVGNDDIQIGQTLPSRDMTVPSKYMTGKLLTPAVYPADDCNPPSEYEHEHESEHESEGGGDRDSRTSVPQQPPQQLRITVADEGIGIEEGKQSMLFKPFQQTMRLAGGTGLGLYSLSKRVEVLGGGFGVENRPDGRQGSMFWFSIPYSPDVAFSNEVSSLLPEGGLTGAPKQQISTSSTMSVNLSQSRADAQISLSLSDDNSVSTNTLTALVVEDSVVILKATTRMLVNAGYAVDTAANGAIGLDKMKKKVYSTVIMDLQMPIMDGLEATRRLRAFEEEAGGGMSSGGESSSRQRGRRQFIIGASANGADDVMQDALRSGMDLFVAKPFSVADLVKCQDQAAVRYL